jgi:hypothetical protein
LKGPRSGRARAQRLKALRGAIQQDNIVLSGDKKGQVAVWDFEKVYERTVYGDLHRALTNNLRFLGPLHDMLCASASSDGLLKVRLRCLPARRRAADQTQHASLFSAATTRFHEQRDSLHLQAYKGSMQQAGYDKWRL